MSNRNARALALAAITTRFPSRDRATPRALRGLRASLLDAFTRWGGIRAIVAGVDAGDALTCWVPSSRLG